MKYNIRVKEHLTRERVFLIEAENKKQALHKLAGHDAIDVSRPDSITIYDHDVLSVKKVEE